MKYSELFHTIQGEGYFTGVPSVFFRTSYCNLRCSWCDTPYTSWTPENKDISVDDAVTQICDYDCKHVVITGGEPLILPELPGLCNRLTDLGKYITIETNATRYVPVRAQFISMSPKLSNSTPADDKVWKNKHNQQRYKPEVIRQYLNDYFCQVKFVVDNEQDMDEIEQMIDAVPIPKGVVTLMPQGITADEVQRNSGWLIELCKQKGYRFSTRLHVMLWGNKRGV